MCSICKPILPSFGIPHAEERCPLGNSFYCSNCAKYGHLLATCPAKPSRFYTEPAFLEQLIPSSELAEFRITTRTLIPQVIPDEPRHLLEIKDNDKVISAFLQARSIKVRKGQTKRHALEEYAKVQKQRVIYIS
jgi:hypothetical protein